MHFIAKKLLVARTWDQEGLIDPLGAEAWRCKMHEGWKFGRGSTPSTAEQNPTGRACWECISELLMSRPCHALFSKKILRDHDGTVPWNMHTTFEDRSFNCLTKTCDPVNVWLLNANSFKMAKATVFKSITVVSYNVQKASNLLAVELALPQTLLGELIALHEAP